MRRLRDVLIAIILVAITVKIVWWSLSDMIPYLIIGVCLIAILGWVFGKRKW